MDVYFSGEKLYGDDFTVEQIAEWFNSEKEGYANLGAKDRSVYEYPYHAQNIYNGYQYLKNEVYPDVLSIGGAYGDELLPILHKIKRITILEPSDQLQQKDIEGIPIIYVKPNESGRMDFPDNSFNLITCFGVLHHIPNVSTLLREIERVLKPGGIFIVREPIVSMGDWRTQRGLGLTKNERGIPYDIMRKTISTSGLKIKKDHLVSAKPFDMIFHKITGISPYNSPFYVKIDRFLAKLFYFNYRYHAMTWLQKIRPVSCFIIAAK